MSYLYNREILNIRAKAISNTAANMMKDEDTPPWLIHRLERLRADALEIIAVMDENTNHGTKEVSK